MKTLFFSVLLCVMGAGAKAQIADVTNATSCDLVVRFYAIDPLTCTTIATDAGPYIVPAGASPAFVAAVWSPAPPAIPYFILSEVAFRACGFPGVFTSWTACGYIPSARLIPCGDCEGVTDNAGGIFPPGSGAAHYRINAAP